MPSRNERATVVVLEGLSFAFGSVHQVLSDITLSVARGERVALMGPSGSGKTTLLKVIAGFRGYAAQRGKCSTAGRFAMAFQQALLLDHLSVGDNILLPAKIIGCKSDISQVTRLLGLDHLLERYPFQLSGGQQRRVALARALAAPNAEGLLMDEPFTGLDEPLRERILVEVEAALNATGLTCIFATHSPMEAAFLADRVVLLGDSPTRVVAEHEVNLPREARLQYLETREFFDEVSAIRRHISRYEGNGPMLVERSDHVARG
ncbi:MAG: ABC transporter ATP-binding protein [Burkholderiales bacterium]